MKKIFLLSSALIVAHYSQSQHATFEFPVLSAESAWYGQDQVTDGDTIYTSEFFNFETNYNAGWGSYAGWAFSNITDNTTPGWANQFSAIAGVGMSGSDQYGICYVSSWEGRRMFFVPGVGSEYMGSIYVTNTTYAYYAMLNGDSFTKPFGADTNALGIIDGTNGEDWFLLTIYGLGEDSLYTGDSVNFYLADFRFSNDAQDYIIDQWTEVDLSPLGTVIGLDFVLTSSDTSGSWGMNNPAYFAMDDVFAAFSGVDEHEENELKIYPNPTNDVVHVKTKAGDLISVFDLSGKMIFSDSVSGVMSEIDLSSFESGVYFLTVLSDGNSVTEKVIKR